MKNEAPYILEWVAHHKVIGFDHIVVLTNDCSDSTNGILKRLDALGHVTFQQNKPGKGGVHRTAIRRALRLEVVKQADWLYVTDADEFLNIHAGDHSIDALIAASGGDDVDVIGIPWRIFSNNGRSVLRDALVTAQFTDAELPYEDGGAGRRFVKSIFRNKSVFSRIGLHNPHLAKDTETALKWALPGGHQRSLMQPGNHVPPPFGHEVAQINHYAVRSAQAYLLKRFRGRANHQSQTLDTGYWDRWNRGGAHDDSIGRYRAPLDAQLAEFRTDRTLRRQHRAGFDWHKSTLATLMKDPVYQELYRKIANAKPVLCPPIDRSIHESRTEDILRRHSTVLRNENDDS